MVTKRANILYEMLNKGKLRLLCAYSQKTYAEAQNISNAQRENYTNAQKNFPNHLIDNALNIDAIPDNLSGATYLYKNNEEKIFGFNINAFQVSNPKQPKEWSINFGSIEQSVFMQVNMVTARMNQISEFLSNYNINIGDELHNSRKFINQAYEAKEKPFQLS
ncbi:MAG: hypothetical protein J0H68_06015 [Sphingobacteriia bacterium]|nr:hypothetical protein [Sphingobacteriia bacterium]